MESIWFYWVVSLSLPMYAIALGFCYRVLSARQDRTDARIDAFAALSLEDQKKTALDQREMSTRQTEQFNRIMSEITQLRLEIAALTAR